LGILQRCYLLPQWLHSATAAMVSHAVHSEKMLHEDAVLVSPTISPSTTGSYSTRSADSPTILKEDLSYRELEITESAPRQPQEQPHRSSWSRAVWSLRSLAEATGLSPCHRATIKVRPDRSWNPSFIRLGPLSGLVALCVALSSLLASLGILVGSNGAPLSSWTAPPSTYLAICTAVANLAMRYACIQGVVIAWWYRASKGST
jgi:hypothetical protein